MKKRTRFSLSVAVFIFLIKNNQILLLKRKNTGWMDGFWSVPAGALDGHESLSQAAAREAHEEVGVQIDDSDLVLVHTLHALTESTEWMGAFFEADIWSGEPMVCEPEKHAEVRWVNLQHLPETLIPYVRQAIEKYQKGNRYSEYGLR